MEEFTGEWWLAETPSRRVPGTLTIDDNGAAKLALIGEMRSPFEEGETSVDAETGVTTVTMTRSAMRRAGVYPRIIGEARSNYMTLEDCFRIQHSTNLFGGGRASELITCGQVFVGIAFAAAEPLEFDGIAFELKWLTHWLATSGISEEHEFEETPDGSRLRLIKITGRNMPAISTTLADGSTLILGHGIGTGGQPVRERTLSQSHYFRYERTDVGPTDPLADVASDLQDLVSIGVNLTAEWSGVQLLHPASTIGLPGDDDARKGIDWYAAWNVHDRSDKTTVHPHEMVFTFDDFGGMDGIVRWLAVAGRHRSALGRVMASRYSPHMFLSDRVMNRAAALESLDRVNTGHSGSTFATRLRRCAELAGAPFAHLVDNVDRWVTAFKDDRDDIAHHFGRRVRHQTREQFFLGEAGHWLFVMCMMRLADAPETAWDRLAASPTFSWVQQGLADALT